MQALDDAALKFLGRGHNAGEARDAVALAARLFSRFSFDLIYARPGQTLAAWRDELDAALAMAGDHLSLYQLTIEPGTAFATAFARGDFHLPDDESQGALYETTQEALAGAGLPAYEISNHARPGQECRHNLVYWRYQDYLGIGPGAHGRLTLGAEKAGGEKRAVKNFRAPETWLGAVTSKGNGVEESLLLSAEERRDEMLMIGLRLQEGIARPAFRAEAGVDVEAALDPVRMARLSESGFLVVDERGLRATEAGRQRLNAVLAALLA